MSDVFNTDHVKLTKFSHGAGCGCKISPAILDTILKSNATNINNGNLLVGNNTKDDAAVIKITDEVALISTTDFFMPIVDDPFDFGRIAAANAISDVYAMGGTPTMAIAILGWPVDKLSPEIANRVLEGGRAVCSDAGIPLAGGHSIDSPEPIFGLAVNGLVHPDRVKKNNTAQEGDLLFITKKLGIGVLSTAIKKEIITTDDLKIAVESMTCLNRIGEQLGDLKGVSSMTDVTGFGLLGHLIEMASASNLSAVINFSSVPIHKNIKKYIDLNAIPGGTNRNMSSYGGQVSGLNADQTNILADPQTSGGLLIALNPDAWDEYRLLLSKYKLEDFAGKPIGKMIKKTGYPVKVE
jgi:selenide, water dikinase